MKRRYEIRDDQWERIKDILPPGRKPQGGRPAIDNPMKKASCLMPPSYVFIDTAQEQKGV